MRLLLLFSGCWMTVVPTTVEPTHATPDHCIEVVRPRRGNGHYEKNGEELSSWGLDKAMGKDAPDRVAFHLTRAGSAMGGIAASLILGGAMLGIITSLRTGFSPPRWAGETALSLASVGGATAAAAFPMSIEGDERIAKMVADYNHEGNCP